VLDLLVDLADPSWHTSVSSIRTDPEPFVASTKITCDSFELVVAQAFGFTPDEGLSVPRFVKHLFPKWGSQYDGAPVILPPIEGLPAEVPRITLKSSNGGLQCEVAASRVGFTFRQSKDSSTLPLEKFFSDSASKMLEYSGTMETRVARLAGILHWKTAVERPGFFLADHFCKKEWMTAPFNRPEAFEIHAHKRFKMGEFLVNSWVRCKSAIASSASEMQPIVLVEQDINTLAEDVPSKVFRKAEIEAFFAKVSTEARTILNLYFPKAN
jgi:hypothetical protein